MAKNYRLNRVQTEKFTIKGTLSDDGKTITYIDEEKEEKTISVEKCLAKFCGEDIDLSILTKAEMDLSDIVEGD